MNHELIEQVNDYLHADRGPFDGEECSDSVEYLERMGKRLIPGYVPDTFRNIAIDIDAAYFFKNRPEKTCQWIWQKLIAKWHELMRPIYPNTAAGELQAAGVGVAEEHSSSRVNCYGTPTKDRSSDDCRTACEAAEVPFQTAAS